MKVKFNSSLINNINSEILFFSWKELKKTCLYSFELLDEIYLYPISRKWFFKVPLLLNLGSFSLKNRNLIIYMHNGRKNYSNLLKNQVFEHAFILLLRPFFSNLFFRKNFNLREYLCFLFNRFILFSKSEIYFVYNFGIF